MSEKILNALLQLFAILAKADGGDAAAATERRTIVERFLLQQFPADLARYHLARFDALLTADERDARSGRKRTALRSVKVLRICMQVNEELTHRQRYIVLVHLIEFVHAEREASELDLEFVTTVADTFNIPQEEFARCLAFVRGNGGEREDSEHLLYVDAQEGRTLGRAHHLHHHGIRGELQVLHVPSVGMYVMRYFGPDEIFLNGQRVAGDRHHVLTNGSSLRPPHGAPIYYSDILGSFLKRKGRSSITFQADGIEYAFPNGTKGLHELRLRETSGKLIGIMGGSGSGKSTLLNVLNGNLRPSKGRVTINGIDVHAEADRVRGVIGHVSQDDLLIEELTVFQNLFYNAKLCFGDQDDEAITERVLRMLQSLGLYETKDLKVGSALEKTISGGQRKRLNIALELIREPSVLFVDEPTSGLSSRDSENIMDLLRELALKGRLVFVVIHQPSSDIFKMFDRLLLMDQEGHPVYYGDPVEAVVYFKQVTGQVAAQAGQCSACGNVNPEQIFNILEAKLVDEYGNETDQRRISPEAWNEVYRARMAAEEHDQEGAGEVPGSTFRPPGLFRQLEVYFRRDALAKLANRQYVLVNLLEAPVLALVMAFFLRYLGQEGDYVFRENDNVPQYLFIAVIVALFLGLTVAAEEIIRDRKILQREKFLDLSWGGYLASKVGIMFLISAVQTLFFVLIGNAVLGIQGMLLPYWLLLFSTACFANVLGLNVSASFNSAKVIYIVIPVLIIPQLLFSGIIVRFDKLHPWFASERSVPWIGNIMASRWAYEGLAVTQFMENAYERQFYEEDQRMRTANWRKDLWLRELRNVVSGIRQGLESGASPPAADLALLHAELEREAERIEGFDPPISSLKDPGSVDLEVLREVDASLDLLVQHYRSIYRSAERAKEDRVQSLTATPALKRAYFTLMDAQRNESLAEFVTNKNDLTMIVRVNDELVRKSDPIYSDPVDRSLLGAHFYAPFKWLAGERVPTLYANTLVLWSMTLLFMILLWLDLFPRAGRALRQLVRSRH